MEYLRAGNIIQLRRSRMSLSTNDPSTGFHVPVLVLLCAAQTRQHADRRRDGVRAVDLVAEGGERRADAKCATLGCSQYQ